MKTNTEFQISYMIIALLCIPVSLAGNGYVLSKYWEWFVIPLGAPPIGWFHAYGLATLVVYFTPVDTKAQTAEEKLAGTIAGSALKPLILGLLGLLLHSLMGDG